jgi:hypothetical protein
MVTAEVAKGWKHPLQVSSFRFLVSSLWLPSPGIQLKGPALGQEKSAPNFSVQDASAALPQNCQTTKWIVGAPLLGVNVTLVTREKVPVKSGIIREQNFVESLSGLLPRAARVAGGPSFVVAGGQLAVLDVAEFDGNNIGGQGLAIGHGVDANPMLAGI